ncbi:MAG: Hsp70 family protein [Clostridiales bacterium]|jgi:molecular chaperone DnaK (HSP70)|nr:Hsp70 family protein [Clostridiales bacterium]
MGKVFGIDLGTTYSSVAYIDENEKPVVLKNSDGDLATPSVVFFETQTDVSVGSAAKENVKAHHGKVVTFIKRKIGQAGFSLNINGIDLKPEEITSYIIRKVVNDAAAYLRMGGKLAEGETVKDVVITCPAYFGVSERDATAAAGKIAGLNVLSIINEPTAAAITYGASGAAQNKTVLVYDLGGGTFDATIINISPKEIRVVCTGGRRELGGKDWDDRLLKHLVDSFHAETGDSNIMDDIETLQELSLSAERAKMLLTSKDRAPLAVSYEGKRVRLEITRAKLDELTADLLEQTINITREVFEEAEKKGCRQSDVSEILLVGGSSRMPQVMRRVREAFNIETRLFDPDEAVAKGAAIYAQRESEYNIFLEEVSQYVGKSVEEVKQEIDEGRVNVSELARRAAVKPRKGRYLPEGEIKIVNVASRSFGTQAYDEFNKLKLYNIIRRNSDLPSTGTDTFYPRTDNQKSVRFKIMESLSSESVIEPEAGKVIGTAELELPKGVTRNTEIEVNFRLNESGLLELRAKEAKSGKVVEASFHAIDALTPKEMWDAIERTNSYRVH